MGHVALCQAGHVIRPPAPPLPPFTLAQVKGTLSLTMSLSLITLNRIIFSFLFFLLRDTYRDVQDRLLWENKAYCSYLEVEKYA